MDFLKKFFQGIIIGTAAIMPGISGGVLAVIFGIYEPIFSALSSFFKNTRKNFLYLLPYALGGGIGFLLFARIIGLFINIAENEMLFLFSGLVIGGIPALLREVDKFKIGYPLLSCASFIFMLFFNKFMAIPVENTYLRYFIGGTVYSFGSLIPGISASFILINMGIYKNLLLSVHHPDIAISFVSGFIVMSAILIKAVDFIFKKFRSAAYYCVIGFLTASVFCVFPKFSYPFLDTFLFVSGIILGNIAA